MLRNPVASASRRRRTSAASAACAGEPGVAGEHLGGELARVGDHVAVARDAEELQRRAAARLGGAEHVALLAQLEVDAGELEAVERRRDRLDPLARERARLGRGDEQAQPWHAPPADAPAQLVQLRDAEPVGVDDDHGARVRHVDARPR